jgi:Uma2 family endonuclease
MNLITDINQLDFTKQYSYSDYLMWQFDERLELLKGYIQRMSPAPTRNHQRISMNLSIILGGFLIQKSCSIFHAPFDVRLPISEDLAISKKFKNKAKQLPDGKMMTVVQPDISVICDEDKLDERGCVGAPDLVIEILSPGNTNREMKDKFEIYQEAGVKEYWIVEPNDQFILIYSLQKGKYIGSKPYTIDEAITSTILPDFSLNVKEIFQ